MSVEKDTYIVMLKDILVQKQDVLNRILELTKEQEKALTLGEEDMDCFDAVLEKKESLIQKLERFDQGFSDAYSKVQAELQSNRTRYQQEILGLQKQITDITDLSVTLQSLEEKNRRTFEAYLLGKRQQIKDFKISSRTASAYYKSMAGKPIGESYFMDQKK